MLRDYALSATALLMAGLCLVPALAKPPAKLSKVVKVEDLQAEAAAQLKTLQGYTADATTYAESAKHEIPRAAAVLAVLGQALAEYDHPAKSRPAGAAAAKISGPALRDAAMGMPQAKSLAAARTVVARIRAAVAGTARGGKIEHDWTKLGRLHDLMEEVNARNSKLRRALRRSRDPRTDARHAATLAVLGLVILAETDSVEDKTKLPKWKAYAASFQQNMTAVAAGLGKPGRRTKQELADLKPIYLKAVKACNGCHVDFRGE